jgi:hypothetical protein
VTVTKVQDTWTSFVEGLSSCSREFTDDWKMPNTPRIQFDFLLG